MIDFGINVTLFVTASEPITGIRMFQYPQIERVGNRIVKIETIFSSIANEYRNI